MSFCELSKHNGRAYCDWKGSRLDQECSMMLNVHDHDFKVLNYIGLLCKKDDKPELSIFDVEQKRIIYSLDMEFEPAHVKLFLKKIADTED